VAVVEAVGWMDALQEQFGSVPWWIVSASVHIAVLVLMALITISDTIETSDTIVPLQLNQQEELYEEDVPRDIFESDRKIDDLEQVEHPVFVHEEVEELDHMESANNMDSNTAKGQEDAISDIPLGGTGVVGNLGVGGGAAGAFGFRTGGGRIRAAMRGGGSAGSESAVDRALRWLYRHQKPDGHWDGETKYEPSDPGADTDPGLTGLAALAFLSAGHTEDSGKYQSTVQKAVRWMIQHQGADGGIGSSYKVGRGYHQALCGLALAEAYGMSGKEATKRAAQKAIDYSVKRHQTPGSGWRYDPGQDADVSVTGWYVMQLKSAIVAGLDVDRSAFQGASALVDSCTKPGTYQGMVGYKPGYPATPTITSVGALCRQFMGWKRNDPQLVGAADYLMQNLPTWDADSGDVNFYYWYYGTMVMFQMGGDWWKAWNGNLRDMLLEHQRTGPRSVDGSWDPLDARCGEGGRCFTTASGALCLEVYYRYLPIYK
jgi:hypothetical protein